jgi:hypothetical protein
LCVLIAQQKFCIADKAFVMDWNVRRGSKLCKITNCH